MLELINVRKEFSGFSAVAETSLTIDKGEFFSILGPSGSGKSTLLKMLAGFEIPSSGKILHNRSEIQHLPPYRRPFNMVFQNYALFPHLNVMGNVAFGPRRQGLPKSEVKLRVEQALSLVAMGEFIDRGIETLSGGQQQRIAIARAIANRPDILLLDEPLSALDLRLRQHMQTELKNLQRQLGITFIYVTHAQDEALTLSDRIAVMTKGSIAQIGTPEEIYKHPKSMFVAEFIGSINTIPATIVGLHVQEKILDLMPIGQNDSEFILRASVDDLRPWQLGAPVNCLIRPESLLIRNTQGAIPLRVSNLAFKGNYTVLELSHNGLSKPLSMEIRDHSPSVGSLLHVYFPPDAITVLPGSVP